MGDERVLEAVRRVPRDRFVDPAMVDEAWANRALPIAGGQTISQPLVVARMCALLALDGSERVLDVGTGSGYHAALLARLAAHVWSVERDPDLCAGAAERLRTAGVTNVTLRTGDGAQGLPEAAPFDAINVAAATASIPAALEEQLAPGGRLVAPVGDAESQRLVLVRRSHDGRRVKRRRLDAVRFVPLV